jgi:hypothetical protein
MYDLISMRHNIATADIQNLVRTELEIPFPCDYALSEEPRALTSDRWCLLSNGVMTPVSRVVLAERCG